MGEITMYKLFDNFVSCDDNKLHLSYNGAAYGILLTAGHFDGPSKVCSEDGIIEVQFI